MPDLTLQHGDPAKPAIDRRAEQRERRHADDPSVRSAVEMLRHQHAASGRDSERQHEQRHGWRFLVLDMDAAVRRDVLLVSAERVSAYRVVHRDRPGCLSLPFRKLTQSGRLSTSDSSEQLHRRALCRWPDLLRAREFLQLGIRLTGERHHARRPEDMRLQQQRNQPRPAGLMRRTHAAPRVAVKIFVEQDEIA
jgi:hypothetical protein